MYREMLDEQWERGSLPSDPGSIAALLGGSRRDWQRSWEVLVLNFTILPDGRLQNERLEVEREKQRTNRERAEKGGLAKAQAGAKQRLSRPRADPEQPVSSPEVVPQAVPNPALLLHLPIAFAVAPASEAAKASALVDPEIASRAGMLVERYGELFALHRRGARHRARPNLDWTDACDLCRLWDDARLEKLAVLVLTTDDQWISGTDRSFKIFAIKASWADERLAAWEHEHGVVAV